MPAEKTQQHEIIHVELRNPLLAALWAWAIPGAGHIYQKRYAKGLLFMICILSTYFFGLAIGEGKVVYASWKKNDRRWQYGCQAGIGLAAMPAMFQHADKPLPFMNDWMVPPGPVDNERLDTLASWHGSLSWYFELGTLYTMVAGILNILVVFDAYAGPSPLPVEVETEPPNEDSPPAEPEVGERKPPAESRDNST
jgi:TM2 domain-containing membrane protein YozV